MARAIIGGIETIADWGGVVWDEIALPPGGGELLGVSGKGYSKRSGVELEAKGVPIICEDGEWRERSAREDVGRVGAAVRTVMAVDMGVVGLDGIGLGGFGD